MTDNPRPAVAAVIFDLDGVLIQSEEVWDRVRRELADAAGRPWAAQATAAMMGMSSPEWSGCLRDEVGVPGTPEEISAAVVRAVTDSYGRQPPWIPGAREAVARLAGRWPLGLATSSNREIVDRVLAAGRLTACFKATVSSEEVAAGKPSPDVYAATARALGQQPDRCVAIEDSTNGLRSASAAGMRVIAIPNAGHPPTRDALRLADVVLDSLDALTPDRVAAA